MKITHLALLSTLCVTSAFAQAAMGANGGGAGLSPDTDKYKWLEDVSSERSMTWVKAENARTKAVLEADPRYAEYLQQATAIAEDPRRLASPDINGHDIYNFWQDATHKQGILRRTTIEDYKSAEPHWHTVLDYDALSAQDKTKWVREGENCLYPENTDCIVQLSAGGEDAISAREFDLKTEKFIDSGFTLSHSKQNIAWKDHDTLLVARDWGPGTMTTSSYPFVVKEWKRGTPLDSAVEVFRGKPTDISAGAGVMHDGSGNSLEIFFRGVTFFENEQWVMTPTGAKKLNIPAKSNLSGMIEGRVLLSIDEDWTVNGKTFKQGSLLEMPLAAVLSDPEHLKPTVVFEPTSTEFMEGLAITPHRVLLTTLNNVQGKAYVYTPGKDGWKHKELSVPPFSSVGIISTDTSSDAFAMSITGFLTPSSIWIGDAVKGTLALVKKGPEQFDASNDTVDQLWATSKDGTKIPYFVVHRKDMKYDGTNPTYLNAYGGFQVSETPGYSGNIGKLWLEHGGVYVLANIRGGGEFGPAWHEAGLKTHRQRIYDDFAAVGQDLITRKITSPRHLGILGGSNGGLLMGVEFEQHPDMWNAVVIQVPLLDMINFEHIAAGASWVGEYGSVSVPEERAWLASISPYQNLKPGVKYPEPLIFTTTKDDRVGPQHARKFAAKLEEYGDPFYYDELIEGGHAAGADLKERARTWTETYVYLSMKLM